MHKNVFFLYLINWCSNWLQSVCQNDVCSFWQQLLDLLQTSQQNLTWKLSVTLQRNVKVYKERKKMWETCGVQRGKPHMPDNKSHMRNDIVWVGTVTSLWIHHLVSAIMRHPDAKKTWAICVCKYLNPSPFILAHWMIAPLVPEVHPSFFSEIFFIFLYRIDRTGWALFQPGSAWNSSRLNPRVHDEHLR